MKFYTITAKVKDLFITDTYLADSIKNAFQQLNSTYNIQGAKLIKAIIYTPKNETNYLNNLVC